MFSKSSELAAIMWIIPWLSRKARAMASGMSFELQDCSGVAKTAVREGSSTPWPVGVGDWLVGAGGFLLWVCGCGFVCAGVFVCAAEAATSATLHRKVKMRVMVGFIGRVSAAGL